MSGLGKIIKIIPCANCGADVEIRHKNRLKAKNICCSKKCIGELLKKNNPNYIPCVVCGTTFYCKPSARVKNGNCCSKECLAQHRQVIFLGDKNPNYGNRGSDNPIWKSDEKISYYGYRLIRMPNHPFANCDGFVFEHRLIAEQYLLTYDTAIIVDGKRYLSPNYIVHHKDKNKLNNNVDNLEIMKLGEHSSMHNKENPHPRDSLGRFM